MNSISRNGFRPRLGVFVFVAVLGLMMTFASPLVAQQSEETPALPPDAPAAGNVPGNTLGGSSDSEIWRQIREGVQGQVSLPDARSGVMVQSEGDNWRAVRNGPLMRYGAWTLLGIVVLLALFFLIRGRIRIEEGKSGHEVERFGALERFTHWMTAISFIVLALTGLILLYGRTVLLPVMGPGLFAGLAEGGKYAHNFLSFAFMLGIVMMFVLWVRHNIPNRYDVIWLLKGGGLFAKGVHPPSKKFNAGQKIIFWAVILGGISISLSGIALLFPFEFGFFAPTFQALNVLGLDLPTALSPMEEMQLSQLWHAVVGLVLIVIVIAHIYIGSLGMEGAFDAMGTGKVDANWAKEHHPIWAQELERRGDAPPGTAPRQPSAAE